MANLHLVTGYAGYEHIKATDQGAFNAALIGTGQFVLEKGSIFEAQVQTSNLVRVLDGELMMQGRFVRLEPDTYADLIIENGEQGKLRNDIIVARYTKDINTGVEECNLVVIKGEAVDSDPVDPAHEEGDITNGVDTVHDFPLWRIPLNGVNVGDPVALYGTPFMDSMQTLHTIREDVNQQLAEQETQFEATLEAQNEEFQTVVQAFGGYTKAETLTDEVKAEYGKDADALPNEIFHDLADATNKVGDIKNTIRTDLGEKWLLCNGDLVNSSEYHELYNICAETANRKSITFMSNPSIEFANGIFVSAYRNSNGSFSINAFTISPLENVVTFTNSTYTDWSYAAVIYNEVAGMWYVFSRRAANPYFLRIFSTDDPMSGNWTMTNPNLSGFDIVNHSCAYCHNGTIVVAGRDVDNDDASAIIVSADSGATWTKKIVHNSEPNPIHVCCHDGTWVIALAKTDTNDMTVLVSTDPLGVWTENITGVSGANNFTDVCYGNGVWVCTNDNSNRLYYSADPLAKNWAYTSSGIGGSTEGIKYVNGYFVAWGRTNSSSAGWWPSFSYTDDISVKPTLYTLGNTDTMQGIATDVAFGNGTWVSTVTNYSSSDKGGYIYKGHVLPSITIDGCYTYIKAKE